MRESEERREGAGLISPKEKEDARRGTMRRGAAGGEKGARIRERERGRKRTRGINGDARERRERD